MDKHSIPATDAPHLADILKGLGHPIRLQIIGVLCAKDMCVGELCDCLGLKQASVSQHLAPLRMLGLVTADRTGGKATYSLAQPKLRNMVTCLKSCIR